MRIGIDIESADTDHIAILDCEVESLTHGGEAIGTRLPVSKKPPKESKALAF